MAEADSLSNAWTVTPDDYLARRAPAYTLPPEPFSVYVTMRDGCRIAVDVHLPRAAPDGPAPPQRVPTVAVLTCYYRRYKLKPGSTDVDPSPNAGRYRDFFVPRGYAVVIVDVRGTGASFGTRDAFRSPREREDFGEIAEWISAQAWSDGSIGATGVSYPGAASTFLASTGHPAVKAVAPLFSVWDSFADHLYPGGIPLTRVTELNNHMLKGLDEDRRDLLAGAAYFSNPALDGPHPVDGDEDGVLLAEALREHAGNFVMTDFLAEFRYRDDPLPYQPDFTPDAFSPCGYVDGFRDGVAVYSVSGWYDGAGFSNASISRFLSLPNSRRHLLLGPWDHGARTNISPWRETEAPAFELLGELLRFFDHYVAGLETGLDREAPIHFYSIHDENWCSAAQWPPPSDARSFHLADGNRLADDAGKAAVTDYRTDFSIGTGEDTRFARLAAKNCHDYYASWHGRDAAMLSYTSDPLDQELHIAGHPILTLAFAASEPDAAIHVYLSEVDADGRSIYVTEGVCRALHRAETDAPPKYRTTWPYHSMARADASPLVPGQEALLRLALLPIAWTFAAGSRIRISISGADADHFMQVPHGRPPILSVRSGAGASMLQLPCVGVAEPESR